MKFRPMSGDYPVIAEKYMRLIPQGDLIEILQKQLENTVATFSKLTNEQALYRYAEGKWSIKEVIGHISDVERLWCYRTLHIARGDARVFPGYDRDQFVATAGYDQLELTAVLAELAAVRQATIALVGNLKEEALSRRGEFNEQPLTALGALCILIGHEIHHRNILIENYLPQIMGEE